MDIISGLITHINLEPHETLPVSTPKPPSKSKITTQQPPYITNTLTGDTPTTSINELRSFCTALSAFISRYDELQRHFNFIKSAIDSKLPNHLGESANPNLSALTCLLETSCDQSITSSPEVVVLEQNPREIASDCGRSHESATTLDSTSFSNNFEGIDNSKKLEVVDVSKNHEEIDVYEDPVEIDSLKTLEDEETDTSKKHEETVPEGSCDQTLADVPEAIVSEQNPNGMATDGEQSHENVTTPERLEESKVLNKPDEVNVSNELEQTDICKVSEESVALKKLEELDTSSSMMLEEIDTLEKHEESVPETSCDQTMTVVSEAIVSVQIPNGMAANCEQSHENVTTPECLEEIDVSKKPAVVDIADTSEKYEQNDILNKPEEIGTLEKPEQNDICENPEETVVLKKPEELDTLMIPDEIDASKNQKEVDISKKPEETIPETSCDQTTPAFPKAIVSVKKRKRKATNRKRRRENALKKRAVINTFKKPEQTDMCKYPEETFVLKGPEELDTSMIPEEIDTSKNPEEIDISKKPEETTLETSCDQTTPAVPEAIVSEQKPKRKATNRKQRRKNALKKCAVIDTSKKPEQTDRCKNPEETVVLKGPAELDTSTIPEEIGTLKNAEEIDTSKKPEEAILETSCDQTTPADPEAIVSDQKPKRKATNRKQRRENASKKCAVINISKKPEQTGILNKPEENNMLKKPEQTVICKDTEETVALNKPEELDTSIEIDASKNREELDIRKKPEEIVPETSCNQTTPAEPESIVSEQKPKRKATNRKQRRENASKKPAVINISKKPEQTGILNKPEEIDILKKPEQMDICNDPKESVVSKKPEQLDTLMVSEEINTSKNRDEIDTLKKPEVTIPETSCDQTTPAVPEAIVSEQKPKRKFTNSKQRRENASKKPAVINISKKPEQSDILNKLEEIDELKKPEEHDTLMKHEETGIRKKAKETGARKKAEETGIRKKAEETGIRKKAEETETSKKSVVSVLQFLCQSMNAKEMKHHVATHFSDMINLREEVAKALKLAEDPAKLVLSSVGRFFVQGSKTFRKPHRNKENLLRMAAVLILECFVMISGDGIKIAKSDRERAAEAAVDWRKRMIREGGFGHTDEVDARGLLLLISGFRTQDHVFSIQDIMDLIRASNVKGISTALCRSVFLIPKIPEVIYLMEKNNLEVEAVDIAYTFGMEFICHPRNILMPYLKYLKKKIEEFLNGSSFQMPEAVKQHLFDLKSVKQCLESHNVDPSTLVPDFNIIEEIQNLEKKVQKRKSLENLIHQEAKRSCFGHESMPRQQTPTDHCGINRFNRSTHPSPSYFNSDQNLSNINILNHSPSSVYNASAMPENIPGFLGSHDQTVHMVNVQPYGRHGPYDQLYLRHGLTYDSQPYLRPLGCGPPESFPRILEPRGPSWDLYSFADIVEKRNKRFSCMR